MSALAAGRDPSLQELSAIARHARGRLALYRRRVYLGGGDRLRLAELERELQGAQARLAAAQQKS